MFSEENVCIGDIVHFRVLLAYRPHRSKSDCLLWIYGMSIFFVIKYAKDFIDQRLR